MSDRVVKPVNDANNKSRQTLWLAHWKRTSCDAAGETIGPNSSGDKELENVTRNGDDLTEGLEGSSRSVEGLNMIKARTSEIGYDIIKVSSNCHLQPNNSVKACSKHSITCDHYLSTYGFNRLAKMQKLQNSVDASEGMPEGCSRFSQMTNGLLITKTDVNVFIENYMVRNRRLIANTKGNISNEFHCLSPLSGHGKQQVILQPLNSDSEVKENIGDVKAFNAVIRNESSAQTDTMNMDSSEENSKKNPHSGSNSTASNKAFNLKSHIPSSSNVASSREVLPAIPRAATSSEAKPKSNFSVDDLANADPGERWVKRLKLCSRNPSAQGAKSSNLTSCQVKISKLFGGIPKSSTTSLEKSVVLGKSDEKGKEASSSDAWIKRWLYTKCEAEPQSSKVSLEEQLPSIAAMALMGKAFAYLQPCEFRKRGSCTVWNIKAC